MLHLAIIFHMHQPYYKNLLTKESSLPWVRLHGSKDYLDMVEILKGYPQVRQCFNLVPSLVEQVEDYCNGNVKDKWLELSLKPALKLDSNDKNFLLENFFSINKEKVISTFPRYYELYFKRQKNIEFTAQDLLDLQVLFNLSWIDPTFREKIPELAQVSHKARFFTEDDKNTVLSKQIEILKGVIEGYNKAALSGQVEVIVSPYYHPILPLLYSTNTAKEANANTVLPKSEFAYPQDAAAQVNEAVEFYRQRFGASLSGMWPSEEAVSEEIVPIIIKSGVKWIVTDEGILFRSLNRKKRDTRLLYQPYVLKREEGDLNIVFRDTNLSDLIGFVYNGWEAQQAADDFMKHLKNTSEAFKGRDILVTLAMDGENAWEYFSNDGHDFLNALYKKISDSDYVRTVTVAEYLKEHPPKARIKRLAAGSWIYSEFGKWIGNPHKAKAWEWLVEARVELEKFLKAMPKDDEKTRLALKQMYICEGSDWFWWYGEEPEGNFDRLYRMHLSNLYTIMGKETPAYLNSPLLPDKS